MTDLLLFGSFALAAVWSRGRLDQAATALAVLLAWRGLEAHGWVGWTWNGAQAGWYALLAVFVTLALVWLYWSEIERHRTETKPLLDYAALIAWGVVQQGVLLGYMAQVHAVAAVLIFAVVHLPNRLLTGVTLVGGAASVWIAGQFGAAAILPAGLAHAALSWFIRDVIGADMGVGRGYLINRLRIL